MRYQVPWLFLFIVVATTQTSSAFIFDRRPAEKTDLTYLVVPVVVDIPGTGQAAGLGLYSVGILGDGVSLIGGKIQGDFDAEAVWVGGLPTGLEHLSLSTTYIKVQNLSVDQYGTGSNSPSDPSLNFQASQSDTLGLDLSYRRHQGQLEFFASAFRTVTAPQSYATSDGIEFADTLDPSITSWTYRIGGYLDDTDNRRDPHIGYRTKWDRWAYAFSDGSISNSYQDDLDLAAFYPMFSSRLVWASSLFYSQSTVTRKAVYIPYTCPEDAAPECAEQALAEQQLFEQEASLGSATALGGTQRMRAYPGFRFQDAYSFFIGNELRYYALENWLPFDFLVARGVYNSLQFAAFYELGQVSSRRDSSLYSDFKTSTGLGLRAIFSSAVFRLDHAWGEEGSQTSVFWGYPF